MRNFPAQLSIPVSVYHLPEESLVAPLSPIVKLLN